MLSRCVAWSFIQPFLVWSPRAPRVAPSQIKVLWLCPRGPVPLRWPDLSPHSCVSRAPQSSHSSFCPLRRRGSLVHAFIQAAPSGIILSVRTHSLPLARSSVARLQVDLVLTHFSFYLSPPHPLKKKWIIPSPSSHSWLLSF